MIIKLKEDGTLVEPLPTGSYLLRVDSVEDVEEINAEGQHEVVRYAVQKYHLANDYRGLVFTYKEVVSRGLAETLPAVTVESVVSDSKFVVDLVTKLRGLAAGLIKDLPLKNATQREYALTVALTNKDFAESYLMLPEKFQDTII